MAERDGKENKWTVCFDGDTYSAEQAFINIFRMAAESIVVVDAMAGIKTLETIGAAKADVPVIVYTDNGDENLKLTRDRLKLFFSRNPRLRLLIGTVAGKYSNRYIILDSGTPAQKVFLLSAPAMFPAARCGCIVELKDTQFIASMLEDLEKNSYLVLK